MADTITPLELFHDLAAGRVSEILDVRNVDEFAAAPVEGPRPVRSRNVPVYRVGVPMIDNKWMWERIIENQFPLGTKPHRQAAGVQP